MSDTKNRIADGGFKGGNEKNFLNKLPGAYKKRELNGVPQRPYSAINELKKCTGKIMNTFSIIAIPFFATAVVLLTLGATRKNRAFFIVGGVMMASTVVNAVIGLAL